MNLPIDLFIQQITYLPFDDVISVCQSNSQFHDYCTNEKYNTQWKSLIYSTFGNVYGFENKIKNIAPDRKYNYLVYTQFVKLLDPVTQLMIYYKQGDWKSFNKSQYTEKQRFLALFLLGKKDEMLVYHQSLNTWEDYVNLLENKPVSKEKLNGMLINIVSVGNIRGIDMMLQKGANIHYHSDWVLKLAAYKGYIEVIKYLMDHGIVHPTSLSAALVYAIQSTQIETAKYLLSVGAKPTEFAIGQARENGLNLFK